MSWLLENTLVAGGAAVLVYLFGRLFRPRPALAHLLWLLVLLKLVCPPLWRLPMPFEAPVSWSALVSETAFSEPTQPPSADLAALLATSLSTPLSAATGSPAPDGEPSSPSPVLILWIVGSLAMFAALALGILRLLRMARAGATPAPWLQAEVDALARRIGVTAPRVVVTPRIGSALVWGLWRPTLMWPTVTDHRDRRRVQSILAHELAHLRRRDHWTAWLEVLATLTLWWHPLVWLARSRLRLQAELACDAWAVWAVPEARHAFAGALIDAVARDSQAVTTVPVLAARPGARRAFEERLNMILTQNIPTRVSAWAVAPLAALSLTVLSSVTFAQEKEGESKPVRSEVLRSVNAQLRKALGEGYQVHNLGEIRGVVDRYIRERGARANAGPKSGIPHRHEAEAGEREHGHEHGESEQTRQAKRLRTRLHEHGFRESRAPKAGSRIKVQDTDLHTVLRRALDKTHNTLIRIQLDGGNRKLIESLKTIRGTHNHDIHIDFDFDKLRAQIEDVRKQVLQSRNQLGEDAGTLRRTLELSDRPQRLQQRILEVLEKVREVQGGQEQEGEIEVHGGHPDKSGSRRTAPRIEHPNNSQRKRKQSGKDTKRRGRII